MTKQEYCSCFVTNQTFQIVIFLVFLSVAMMIHSVGASVVHDPQEVYNHFFGTVLSEQFRDPGLAFDAVVFMSNNLFTLCYSTNIFSHFFPNILKVGSEKQRGVRAQNTDGSN